MRVVGRVKLYWEEDSFVEGLKLKVKFKLPNQMFNRSRNKTLANPWWIGEEKGFEDWNEFWNYCFKILGDREYLEGVAKELIIEYIKQKLKETDKDKNRQKLLKMLKEVETFNVEVDYK